MVSGYAGKYLEVDLTTRSISKPPTDMDVAKKFIGGQGYASYLLWTKTKAGTDPLGPDNILIINIGPLTGLLGTSRVNVTCKSPQTELHGNTQMGGDWGAELKFAGYDGIVFTGKADSPVYLYVKDDVAEIKDAKPLWGKTTTQTDIAIHEELKDPFVQVICIGPAGEKLVRYADITQWGFHAAARTGAGCVMGLKNLKAVAVRGTKGMPSMARTDEVFKLLADEIKATCSYSYVRHPSVYSFNRIGSTAQLSGPDAGRGVVKNFDEGDAAEIVEIGGLKLQRRNRVRTDSCIFCSTACMQFSVVRSGPFAGTISQIDWDSSSQIGQNCMIWDIDGLQYINALGDEMGLDDEEVGNVVAWAMECYEKGILTKADLDGIDLKWGDAAAEAKLVWKICNREGIGNPLADGFKYFLPKIGKGTEAWAMHSKGVGFGGYQPWERGVLYAICDIGGHHNTPSGSGYLDNSLTTCLFARAYWPTAADKLKLFNAVTGWDYKQADLDLIGERLMVFPRAYNIREGYGGVMPPSTADVLPEKAFRKLTYGYSKDKQLTKEQFLADRAKWYADRGCDERGVPKKETLTKLGLDFTIPELETAGAWR